MQWYTTSPLVTRKIGPCLWILEASLTATDGIESICVPRGFITDGASVPRLFQSFISPMGTAMAEGAVVHDFLYSKDSKGIRTKSESDDIFESIGSFKGASWMKSKLAWLGVAVGGKSSYQACYSTEKLDKSYYPDFFASKIIASGVQVINILNSHQMEQELKSSFINL
jgi:hypothetical protein